MDIEPRSDNPHPPTSSGDMPTWMRRARPLMNLVLGLGALAVLGLTVAQLVFLRTSENAPGAMPVPASTTNPNVPNHRGIFLQMTDGKFQELLPITEPNGYVVPLGAANFPPGQVNWIVVSGSMNFTQDQYRIYKLYRDGSGSDVLATKFETVLIGEDKVVRYRPTDGNWPSGAYLIDTATDSMMGGRTYAYFIIGDWVTPTTGQ